MRTACTALALVGALLIATPVGAAGKKKDSGKDAGVPYFQSIDKYLKPVTLSDDQKTKLDGLKKEYEPKLKEAYAKEDVLTPEQKTAAKDAEKAAKAAGKKGKEVRAAVDEAVKKTDDQKKQEKEARKQRTAVEKELHGKIVELLTTEQKAQIKAAKEKKTDKPVKSEGDKPAKPEGDKPAKEAAAK